MDNSYKLKYLKYKTKYLELKKQMGGNITDVFEYLDKIKSNINRTQYDILYQFATSFLEHDPIPDITVDDFIKSVKSLYDIDLLSLAQKASAPVPRPRPVSPVLAASASNTLYSLSPQSTAVPIPVPRPRVKVEGAVASSMNGDMNTIKVYTTGIAYFEPPNENYTRHVQALIDNIVNTCRAAGKTVEFIHYDNEFANLSPRYYANERFIKQYLTEETIRKEISNKPNVLLVDLAHLIHYYSPSKPGKIFTGFHNPDGSTPPKKITEEQNLNINSFYPGFIGDLVNIDYIRNFRFFRIDGLNIITYIQKGYEKKLKLEGRYRDYKTVFYNFIIDKFELDMIALANTNTPDELNRLFW